MERIQPPPNYYGAPYPQNQEMNNYPQMGYPNPNVPPYNQNGQMPNQEMTPQGTNPIDNVEEFYETFNKLVSSNLGRHVIVYCSFTDSTQWHDKTFSGVLASAGDNYIIIYDDSVNRHYLIVGVYIDFIEFTEKLIIDGHMSK